MVQVLQNYGITTITSVLSFFLFGCNQASGSSDFDPAPREMIQAEAAGLKHQPLMEPSNYLRLSQLAAAIRKAGHACERVRTYRLVDRKSQRTSVYKVECLEYSYRLDFNNDQSRVQRWVP